MSELKILTANMIQEAEQAYLGTHSDISLYDLMLEAGTKSGDKICELYSPQKTLILSGPGNNGGDGFVIYQSLKKKGWDISIAVSKEYIPKGEACEKVYSNDAISFDEIDWDQDWLIIDALFGIGLMRDIEGEYHAVIDKTIGYEVISIDMPSGINSDTGAVKGIAINAKYTLTFSRKKVGQMLLPGKAHAGHINRIPMCFDELCDKEKMMELDLSHFQSHFKVQPLDTNKYKKGHLCIITENDYPGAIILAAMAARKSGVGYVSILQPSSKPYDYIQAMPGVVLAEYKDEADIFEYIQARKVSQLLIGPGIKASGRIKSWVVKFCDLKLPLILDAGAITSFKDDLTALNVCLHEKVILLPYEGEMRSLMSFDSKADLLDQSSHFENGHWFVKGNDGLIFSQDQIYCLGEGGTHLAVAGTGDILAGLCGGLIAYFDNVGDVLKCAIWSHKEAGEGYEFSLIPEELPARINYILADVFNFMD